MLTVAEAAVVLRVSRTTAYKLAEEWRTSDGRDGLPVVKLGRRLVVRRVDLAKLVGQPAEP
jgi:excisionase family DNA binding protein